VRNCQRIW